ncbi:MAG: hypothetical protein JWN38_416 [Candidatus Saccharibacteria bacterium]|nr:hypothetical protein [Candidatus Saccharibacteria bacterium]
MNQPGDPSERRLQDVINSPEQRGAELLAQARDLFTGENAEVPVLLEIDNDNKFLVTPGFYPARDARGDNSKLSSDGLAGNNFHVACRVDKKGKLKYQKGAPLYLIVNGNYINPQLQFDAFSDGLLLPDGTSLNDDQITDIMQGLREVASKRADTLKRAQSEKERIKHDRHVTYGVLTSLLAIGGAATGLTFFGIDRHHDHQQAALAREQQKIAAYDASHPSLDTAAIAHGAAAFIVSQPDFFDGYVPKLKDTLAPTPRERSVSAGPCTQIGTVGLGQSVRLVTNAPNEQALASVAANGDIDICIKDQPVAKNASQPKYLVAVQATS